MFHRCAGILLCLHLLPGIVRADDPLADAQMVISRQIEALVAEDADAAYSLASPNLRSSYPDKDLFFEMIRKDYEPVYRAANYAFGRSKLIGGGEVRSEEHTSELQSLMRISYAVFCLKKKKN